MHTDNEFLTPAQAAEFLGTSTQMLRKSRCSGLLWGQPAPLFKKYGRQVVRYEKKNLIAFLDNAPDMRISDVEVDASATVE